MYFVRVDLSANGSPLEAGGAGNFIFPASEFNVDNSDGGLKWPWTLVITATSSISTGTPVSSFPSTNKKARNSPSGHGMMQLKLCGPKTDPSAPLKMDIALADFLHSHCLPFALAEDPKLLQLLQVACSLGSKYKPPTRELISGKYLDAIHETSRSRWHCCSQEEGSLE